MKQKRSLAESQISRVPWPGDLYRQKRNDGWRVSPAVGGNIVHRRICGLRCHGKTLSGQTCKRKTCRDFRYCPAHLSKEKGLAIRPTKYGMGLFATRKFKRGQTVDRYYGERLLPAAFKERYDFGGVSKDKRTAAFAISGDGDYVDALAASTAASYGNDPANVLEMMKKVRFVKVDFIMAYDKLEESSRGSNAKIGRRDYQLSIIATKDIKEGDEITYYYGSEYWSTDDMPQLIAGKSWH